MMDLGRKFIGGTVWMSASQLVTYILGFGANIILARLLAPDDFGVFALGLSIFAIFNILVSWSFPTALIQAVEINQELFDTACILSMTSQFTLFGLVLASSLVLKDFYSAQVVRILIILSAIRIPFSLSSCFGATLRRKLEYRTVSFVEIGTRVTSMILGLVLAWLGLGIWSLVCKEAFFAIGSFFGMLFASKWRLRWHFNVASARHLLGFGSKMFVASGVESFLSNFQSFIVGTILGTESLGYFDRALKLSGLGHTVAGPGVNQVSLAAYSRLQTSEDKLGRAFEAINYFLVRIFVLVGVLFLLFGEEITVLLYGEKWRTAGKIVPLLFVYIATLTVFGNVKHFLYSQARIGEVVKVRAVQGGLLVMGMMIALQRYELVGAVLVLDILYLVGIVLVFAYVRTYLNINFGRVLLPPVLAGFVAVFLVWGVQFFGLWIESSALMVALAALAVLAYLGILWLLERKRLQRDIRFLFSVIGAKHK